MTAFDVLRGSALYLDSNVFIYAFEAPGAAAHAVAAHLFQEIQAKSCAGRTSLLTRAEVLVRPLRLRQVQLLERYRALLSGVDTIAMYGLDVEVIELAASLRADYPALKLPDALHIATAINANCRAFITSDQRLSVVSGRIPVIRLDQLAAS